MKIHEYQAKNILKKHGVAVPRGEMVETREAAEAAAKKLFDAGATGVVVKAQIHAGGRGKGGGVKIAKSVAEAAELASRHGQCLWRPPRVEWKSNRWRLRILRLSLRNTLIRAWAWKHFRRASSD